MRDAGDIPSIFIGTVREYRRLVIEILHRVFCFQSIHQCRQWLRQGEIHCAAFMFDHIEISVADLSDRIDA